jgi:DNA-binding transcriptional MerR regulator
MRVIDVARKLNISTTWIRKLEKDGVVSTVPRDINGHRRYSDEDLQRIKAILKQGKREGR